jgi:iron complex outermembrane receptor protein
MSLLTWQALPTESLAQAALGQGREEAGAPAKIAPSDIVVTGQRAITAAKVDAPIVETPGSISVVTRDQLDRQGVTGSLTEILRYVPGVQAEPYGFDPRVDRFFIRGFNASGFGLYRDSLQLPSFGDSDRSFRVEPYGLERLEILRGPSSVLYGNGSLGGVVNAISKRPTDTPLHEVELEAGNFNRYAGKFDFSGPIDQAGTFLYRLTGLARDSDTQVDFSPDNRLYIAPALTWKPGDRTSLTLLAHYQRVKTAGNSESLSAEGTLFASPNGTLPRSRSAQEPGFSGQISKEYGIGYALEHRFTAAVTFRQNLRYDHLTVNAKDVFSSGLDPTDPAQRQLLRAAFTGVERVKAFALDNQLQADFTTGPIRHTLLAGVDYKHIDFDDAQGFGDAAPIDIFNPTYGAVIATPALFLDSNTRQGQTGLYLNDRMKIADHLVISLGGRQDFVSKRLTDRLGGTSARSKDRAFSGSAGILYLADSGFAPYFNYSESFLPVFGADLSGKPFEPEMGRQFEAGLKYQPRGSGSFVSVAGFDLTRRNVLTPDPAAPDVASVQTGEQRSRGIEVEAVASLLRKSLNITAAYTYQDVKTTRSTAGDEEKRPIVVPSHLASFYADYAFTEGTLAGFGLGAGVRYQGQTFADTDNSLKIPGFTLFDASLRYDIGPIRLGLNAKNLFDKRYLGSCFSFVGSPTSCTYGASRTVVGTARYRF